jgi:anti-anti-sigma regulatory factor
VALGSAFLVQEGPGGLVFEVLEDVEFDALAQLSAALFAALSERTGPRLITVNVTGRFVGLAAVKMLAEATDAAGRHGRQLVVVGLSEVWDRALPVAGLGGRVHRQRPEVYG